MHVVRSKTMERLVILHQYLKVDSLLHSQPVEFRQHWCCAFRRSACAGDNACCMFLAPLEFAGCGPWQPNKQAVAEVKARGDRSVDDLSTCVLAQEAAYEVDIPDLVADRPAEWVDVIYHGHLCVKQPRGPAPWSMVLRPHYRLPHQECALWTAVSLSQRRASRCCCRSAWGTGSSSRCGLHGHTAALCPLLRPPEPAQASRR